MKSIRWDGKKAIIVLGRVVVIGETIEVEDEEAEKVIRGTRGWSEVTETAPKKKVLPKKGVK